MTSLKYAMRTRGSLLRYTFFLYLLSLFVTTPSQGFDASIIATVNEQIITVQDFRNRLRMIMASSERSIKDAPPELKQQVLDLLISEELQLSIGRQFGITIDRPTIEAAVRAIEQQNGMKAGDLKRELEKSRVPFSVMEKHLTASIIWREYIRERYMNLVQVSDHEVERYLAEQKASQSQPRYLLSELIIPEPVSERASSAKNQANRARQKLLQGMQFAMLATQLSSAPSALRGGDIGWVPESLLDPNVARVIRETPNGKITPPLRTERGYAIYHVRDRLAAGENMKPTSYISFIQVFVPVARDAFEFEIEKTMRSLRNITRQIRSESSLKRLLPDSEVRSQTVNDVPLMNLPAELKTLLKNVAVGRASDPVFTGESALFFLVTNRRTEDPHNLTADEVRDKLIEQKLQNVAALELRNRRAAAHVDIRQPPTKM